MHGARAVKGMVQVAGRTYRIVRIGTGFYAVFRILDDVRVGTFKSHPALDVTPEQVDAATLMAVARQAIHSAKTSWIGSVKPTDVARASSGSSDRLSARLSSVPPPP